MPLLTSDRPTTAVAEDIALLYRRLNSMDATLAELSASMAEVLMLLRASLER